LNNPSQGISGVSRPIVSEDKSHRDLITMEEAALTFICSNALKYLLQDWNTLYDFYD